jgi:hypothetical protein
MYKHKYILKDNKLSNDNKQSSNLLLKLLNLWHHRIECWLGTKIVG